MASSFLLAIREGLEAALIIAIILGVLKRTGQKKQIRQLWLGVLAAVVVSIIGAWILQIIGAQFEGRAEEIFEGVAMLLAAAVLTWVVLWLNGKNNGLQVTIEKDVDQAVQIGGTAILLLAFLAVVREGLELALFLSVASMAASGWLVLSGAALGLLAATFLGWVLFTGTRKLPLRTFFKITTFLLVFFAAGLVSHGLHELVEAGLVPAILDPLYNINAFLPDDKGIGLFFKTLLGYNGNPALVETIAYGVYLVLAAIIIFFRNPNPKHTLAIK